MASGAQEQRFYFKFKSHVWLLSVVLGNTAPGTDKQDSVSEGEKDHGEKGSREGARE